MPFTFSTAPLAPSSSLPSSPTKRKSNGRKHILSRMAFKLYMDYDEMIKQKGLEAVVVATITTAHAEESIKAMKAGLHILCEKPLSTSVEVVRLRKTRSSQRVQGLTILSSHNQSLTPQKHTHT